MTSDTSDIIDLWKSVTFVRIIEVSSPASFNQIYGNYSIYLKSTVRMDVVCVCTNVWCGKLYFCKTTISRKSCPRPYEHNVYADVRQYLLILLLPVLVFISSILFVHDYYILSDPQTFPVRHLHAVYACTNCTCFVISIRARQRASPIQIRIW